MCFFTFFLLSIYTIHYYYKYSKRKNPLPGPIPLPFIGNLYQFGILNNKKEKISNEFINELFSQYGDIFETYSFNERIIWINRIDLAEKFLNVSTTTNGEKKLEYDHFYLKNKNEVKELKINEMGIYYNHEYNSWKFHRNVLTKCVTLPKFLKEIVMELQEQFKELENYWNDIESVESLQFGTSQKDNLNDLGKENTDDDKIIDISKWINCFTMDIFLQSITREKSFSMANYFNQITKDEENKLRGIESILDKSDSFIKMFRNSSWLLDQFNFILIGLPEFLKKLLPVYRLYYRNHFNDYWRFYETLLKIVRARRFEISNLPKEQGLKADILTSLIYYGTSDAKNEDKRALTDDEVVFTIKDFMNGGIGAISNSFSYIIYYICKYPTIKYRMIEEIDSLLGNNHNQNDTFTYFILAKLYYCEAVIKEVLRIHSVHPLISRVSNEKDNIGGYTWDNGQMFYVNLHAIHNHKFNWKNPEDFDPERFLYSGRGEESNEEVSIKERGNFLIREELRNPLFTFGMGLRSCPAKDLAMIMLKTMIVIFLRNYDVILIDKDLKLQINYHNMLNNCEELKVKIRPRHHRNQSLK